ncbi:MAG: DUF4330 family protein [Clostridia bacterium]|nr:DUF4330 family protein [Clostridia bacterium]
MDKNGKLFNKINIIDFCVILLIIVFIIGIGIRLMGSTSEDIKTPKTFEYTVEVSNIRGYSVDALKKLGNITDSSGDIILGEIISVEDKPYITELNTLNGEIIESVIPEKYSCLVKIQTTGNESDEFYFDPNDTELSVGKSVNIITKYVNTSGLIKALRIVE